MVLVMGMSMLSLLDLTQVNAWYLWVCGQIVRLCSPLGNRDMYSLDSVSFCSGSLESRLSVSLSRHCCTDLWMQSEHLIAHCFLQICHCAQFFFAWARSKVNFMCLSLAAPFWSVSSTPSVIINFHLLRSSESSIPSFSLSLVCTFHPMILYIFPLRLTASTHRLFYL